MLDANGDPITDEHGNTLGGVRSPAVDVPISKLSGHFSLSANQLSRLEQASRTTPPYPHYPYWNGQFSERNPPPIPFEATRAANG